MSTCSTSNIAFQLELHAVLRMVSRNLNLLRTADHYNIGSHKWLAMQQSLEQSEAGQLTTKEKAFKNGHYEICRAKREI